MTAVIGAKPGKGHAGAGTRLFHSLVSYLVLAVTYLFVRPYQNRHAQEQNCQAVDMPPYGNQAPPHSQLSTSSDANGQAVDEGGGDEPTSGEQTVSEAESGQAVDEGGGDEPTSGEQTVSEAESGQAVDEGGGTNQRPESKRCPKLGAVRQWTVAETNQRPESKRCPKLRVVKQWTVAETSAKQTIVQNKRFVRAVPRAVPNLQIQPPKMPQHRKSSAKRQEVEVNAKPSGRRKAVRTRAQAKGRARAGQPARMLYRVWPAAWEPILHSHCCSVWA